MLLKFVLVSELLLEASSDFSEALFNLLHFVLGYSLLVEDGVIVSLENVFGREVALDGVPSTGNSVVVRWRRSVHLSFISLSVVVKAAEVSSQILVAYLASVFVLEL